ncbi:30S ribosomal protein S7 [Dehalogenimonas etheniformans]|uniref:Small ribosomal subunit protein uS7 n=1 Tax=Dehalogenimonas etheniformans TaxID=1536648 RepID=A0A2P5P7G6_9CHLR|nr:30S ribosomal protein S7 [Dehalogenimonas etheniformans]PPD58253.1 30S ribosomal protein S7 [Dehalogenimonas etheniformans]QNT75662.1 30S ribosomal protein S7 [Dehalogenimonas etheniformans]
MGRRSSGIKHPAMPDAKYNSVIVSKFINRIMVDGKQNTAEAVIYGAMELMAAQEGKDAVTLLEAAVKNVTPMIEVKARRVGGANYQVPIEVRPDRAFSLALRWLTKAARSRSGKSMAEKLSAELSDASKGLGSAVKKREETHKMAEANRAFAHYRW